MLRNCVRYVFASVVAAQILTGRPCFYFICYFIYEFTECNTVNIRITIEF